MPVSLCRYRRRSQTTMIHKKRVQAFIIALILLGGTASCGSSKTPTPSPQTQATPLASIEAFSIDKLAQYRGKIVLLNFWAIWCRYCVTEMPDLESVYHQYQGQGVVILAVNTTEDSASIISFAQKLGLTFPIMRDVDRTAMRAYQVQALPTTVFIDREGKVRFTQVGMMTKSAMLEKIESVLD